MAIYTRRAYDWTLRFQPIADALATLPTDNLILDGEAVVADSRGMSDFALLHADLAASLNNLSICLALAGDSTGARTAIEETVGIRRRLAQSNPTRFEPDLAMSLNTLSNRLAEAGDRTGARNAIEEAVGLYRRLAEANPARFEPDLATSLNNLSACLTAAVDCTGACTASEEAVGLYRRLVRAVSRKIKSVHRNALRLIGWAPLAASCEAQRSWSDHVMRLEGYRLVAGAGFGRCFPLVLARALERNVRPS